MDNREKLIHKVLSSSYLGVMSLFVNFSKELENVRFVFFDNEIGTKLPHYHHIVGNKMSILSVNDDQNFLIFDKKRVQEMLENKQTDFNYDNCVNFDTQVLRYLKELLEKKNVSQNPQVQKLHELLCFLMLKHVDYSCFPYVFENSSKLSSPEILDGVRNNLYAYFYFKSLGLEEYKEVISSYSPVKYSQMIIDQVEEHLSVIQKAKNPEYKDLFLQMKV
ncbi:MAG: hypothetical protein K0S80_3806, partial [Neobacillus sp.]|nr:hypothetical protein [Neobacillus sp.]